MKKRFLTLLLSFMLALSVVGLIACDEKNVTVKVKFMVDGAVYHELSVTSGATNITFPENPSKDGFVFDGWFLDVNDWSKPFNVNSVGQAPIIEDTSVYAKFSVISGGDSQPGEPSGPVDPPTDPVVAVTSVSLDKTSVVLLEGQSDALVATVMPIDATNKTVTYTSSNQEVVIVDNAGNISAIGVGEAVITVTTIDGEHTATCSVTVEQAVVSVTSVTLNKTLIDLPIGCTDNLIATVNPDNADNKQVVWSSSHPNIASVVDGEVTGIGGGVAIITVTTVDGNFTATCEVTVSSQVYANFDNFNERSDYFYTTVSNATEEFSFEDKIQVSDLAEYKIYSDEDCQSEVQKVNAVVEGENIFYVKVTCGFDKEVYKLLVHRNRIFTVTFDTLGGTEIPSVQVEEGSLVSKPTQIPEKVGYSFNGWDYDFAGLAIVEDTTIGVYTWASLTDIPYTVHYYKKALNSTEYVHYAKEDKLGTTGEFAYGTVRTIVGFDYNSEISIKKAEILGDGSTELHLYYDRKTYTVTFSGEGGTLASGKEVQIIEYEGSVTEPVYQREGYQFRRWRSLPITVTYDQTIRAEWTKNEYKINFEANGGSGNMNAQNHQYDTIKGLSLNTFEKKGYDFVGWKDSEGNFYANCQGVKNLTSDNGGEITLIAQWSPRPNTVYIVNIYTQNLSGDRYVIKQEQMLYGQTDSLVTVSPQQLTGFSFNEDLSSISGTINPVTPMTLKLYYDRQSFEVVFSSEGGTLVSGEDIQSVIYEGAAVAPTFERTGYVFNGFDSAYDNIKCQTTVKALWKPIEYTVTFVAGDGKGVMTPQTFTYDKAGDLTLNAYGRDGYSFIGWEDESGRLYTNGESVKNLIATQGGNIILTARWEEKGEAKYTVRIYKQDINSDSYVLSGTEEFFKQADSVVIVEAKNMTGFIRNNVKSLNSGMVTSDGSLILEQYYDRESYSVTFNANGGTVSSGESVQTVKYEGSATPPTVTRKGYTFSKWDKSYNPITDNLSLSAVWKANTYTISFNANGGSGTMSAQTLTYDVSSDISANKFSKAGYTFNGWKDASGIEYVDGQSVRNLATSGTITLTAQWKAIENNKYTVKTYKKVVGSTDYVVAGEQILYGETGKTVSVTASAITGFTYNESKSVSSGVIAATGNLVLSLYYDRNTYTVTFNANGGSISSGTASQTVEFEGSATAPSCARTGYIFSTWDKDYTTVTQNITVNAVWTAITYKITFNANGGSGSMSAMTLSYGQTTNLTNNAFTRTGCTFSGWKDANGKTYTNGQSVSNLTTTNGAEIKLTAQWAIQSLDCTKRGLDISAYQAGINFDQLASSGLSFLILRGGFTGYGGTGTNKVKDSQFENFYSSAKNRGIPVGVYWYSCANNYSKGQAEAEFLYNNCLKGKKFEYPIYIDVEEYRWQQVGKDLVADAICGFCEYLTAKGYLCGTYANPNYFRNYINTSRITKWELWLAQWQSSKPSFEYHFDMWQDSESGSYGGKTVDTDWAYKDYPVLCQIKGYNGYTATGDDVSSNLKSITEIAQEVIAGLWGNGDDRKNRLRAAGYDPDEVQAEVNRLLA